MNTTGTNTDYFVVKGFDKTMDAQVTISLLEANGVECFLSSTALVDVFGLASNSITDGSIIELRVRIEDKQKALDIINAKFDKKDLEEYKTTSEK